MLILQDSVGLLIPLIHHSLSVELLEQSLNLVLALETLGILSPVLHQISSHYYLYSRFLICLEDLSHLAELDVLARVV